MTLTIPDFSRLCLLVAGDAMLDEYWFGDTARVSPEAPVMVVSTRSAEQRPGGAANVALNLAALGVKTALAAVVGADERGETLRRLLEQQGVQCKLVRSASAPTVHKLRVLARSQQLIRLDSEGPLDASAADLGDVFARSIEDADAVVLSDYAKGTLARVAQLIAACRDARVPVLVDPKGTDFERYRGATVLTPNRGEFEAVAGRARDDADFLRRGGELCRALDLEALLVTRGEQGMTLFRVDREPLTLPTRAREVFDVTGAGDTVIALLAAGLAAGSGIEDAAALANLGAGVVVGKIGVATVSRSELLHAQHTEGSAGDGVVDLPALLRLVAEARGRGERIVMTNGCFDILHAGHVGYLEEAKSCGDRLIVAVNDDASVRRLKGAQRPINGLEDRMAVLAGLAVVDWVVPFAADTPADTIAAVAPDVLVKGGDYRVEQIAGADAVLAKGGEVRILRFKPGRSTSAMIEAIRRAEQ